MNIEKVKPWRSPEYLSWVRDQPCCNCLRPGRNQAHHVIGLTGGFMGGKAGDNLAVPLCPACHRDLHDGKIVADAQVGWLTRTLAMAFHQGVIGRIVPC